MREMKDSGIEWLGKIPKGWKTEKIKQNFDVASGSTPSSTIPSFWDGSITWVTPADFKTSDHWIFKGARNITQSGYNSCNTTMIPVGSILFSKRAPVGNVVITRTSLCTNQGCLSCIPTKKINIGYFYYVLSILNEQFELISAGTTFKEISLSTFKNFKLPVPTNEEQQAIANYLDAKCTDIDALQQDLQAEIEALQAYKKSLISRAVTQGLDPHVEMKDSGVEWIGKIPRNWQVNKIGYMFKLRNEKNYLPQDKVTLLSLYAGKGVFPTGEEGTIKSGNHAQTVEGYKVVKKNDVIVNIILAWMGSLGVSDYDGVCSPAYDVYIPNKAKVVPHYYHYVFRTEGIAKECYRYGKGIMLMRLRTYSSDFKKIMIPFPPIEDQQKIADYLDAKCAELDSIVANKQKQTQILSDYKKSLIYEVVTGKKEVPVHE